VQELGVGVCGFRGVGELELRHGFRFRALPPAFRERFGEIDGAMAFRAPEVDHEFVILRETNLQNTIGNLAAFAR